MDTAWLMLVRRLQDDLALVLRYYSHPLTRKTVAEEGLSLKDSLIQDLTLVLRAYAVECVRLKAAET